MNRGREIAEAHADWFGSTVDALNEACGGSLPIGLLIKVYVDAMEHGYKHGQEDACEHFADKACDDYCDSEEGR